MKATEEHFKNQILHHKLEAKKKAMQLLKEIQNRNKLTNWSDCINQKLLSFKNAEYVLGVCHHYYGENGSPSCVLKPRFCGRCCRFHIGKNHVQEFKKCKTQCGKLVFGPASRAVKPKTKKSKKTKKMSKKKKSRSLKKGTKPKQQKKSVESKKIKEK